MNEDDDLSSPESMINSGFSALAGSYNVGIYPKSLPNHTNWVTWGKVN